MNFASRVARVRIPSAPPIITFPHQKVETFFEVSIAHFSQEKRNE
jgi:hypothetical protein